MDLRGSRPVRSRFGNAGSNSCVNRFPNDATTNLNTCWPSRSDNPKLAAASWIVYRGCQCARHSTSGIDDWRRLGAIAENRGLQDAANRARQRLWFPNRSATSTRNCIWLHHSHQIAERWIQRIQKKFPKEGQTLGSRMHSWLAQSIPRDTHSLGKEVAESPCLLPVGLRLFHVANLGVSG